MVQTAHIKWFLFQVWSFVQRSLILSSLANGILVATSQNNLTFLRCLGREEVFRCSDNLKGLSENYLVLFFQIQLVRLLCSSEVSWGRISRTGLGSNPSFPKHCQLLLCPHCALPVWGHLQISQETYNYNTRYCI